tara:strand:- start:1068 stop:1337 length:270 start_codon:yes stop_codon:yes gene_type:complete
MTQIKNMAYWRAKNTLPGINPNSEGNTDLPDGRSGSSPFQKNKLSLLEKGKTLLNAAKANIGARTGFISGTKASYAGMKEELLKSKQSS